MRRGMQMPGK
jgi:hypothetical protein